MINEYTYGIAVIVLLTITSVVFIFTRLWWKYRLWCVWWWVVIKWDKVCDWAMDVIMGTKAETGEVYRLCAECKHRSMPVNKVPCVACKWGSKNKGKDNWSGV